MTVVHTEKAKVNSESYWDKVNARIKEGSQGKSANAISDYVKGDININTLVDRLQRQTDSVSAIDKGLEAAGVSARSRQDINEAIRKTRTRTASRQAAKEPPTSAQEALTGLLSRPRTKYQGEPADPKDLYSAIANAIRKNQKTMQVSSMADENIAPISKRS